MSKLNQIDLSWWSLTNNLTNNTSGYREFFSIEYREDSLYFLQIHVDLIMKCIQGSNEKR